MTFEQIKSVVATLASDIASGPIVPTVTPLDIRNYLASRYDFTKPVPLDEVIADVERMLRTWQVQVTHPRYFGLFNPSVTLASVIADTLVAMYNPQLATWRTSPAANEIERHTLAWLTGKFGLPAATSATFTTGGAEANLSAVIVALTRAFPGYGEDGPEVPVRAADRLPDARSASLVQQDRAHDGHRAPVAAHGRDRPRSQDGSRGSGPTSGGRPAQRVRTDHGRRYGGDDGGGRDRSRCPSWRDCAGRRTCGSTWTRPGAAPPSSPRGSAAISPASTRPTRSRATRTSGSRCRWVPACSSAVMRTRSARRFARETSYMPGRTAGPVDDPYTSTVQWSRRFIGLKLFLALADARRIRVRRR